MKQLRRYMNFLGVGQSQQDFPMAPYFKVSNLPILGGSQNFSSEDEDECGKTKTFFLFSWNGGELWVPGHSTNNGWRTYFCGYVDVRAINGKVLLKSRLLVRGNALSATFHLERPVSLGGRYPNRFEFCGFRYPVVVGKDFLNFEERRLGNLFAAKRQGTLGPIAKPPNGHLV